MEINQKFATHNKTRQFKKEQNMRVGCSSQKESKAVQLKSLNNEYVSPRYFAVIDSLFGVIQL